MPLFSFQYKSVWHARRCLQGAAGNQFRKQVNIRPGALLASANAQVLAGRCGILDFVYAQKLSVEIVIGNERKPCPLEWLDSFCMRNFTNSADFDDTLPTGEGRVEASFRVNPDQFASALAAWLTQRGKGNGRPVAVEVKNDSATTANTKS